MNEKIKVAQVIGSVFEGGVESCVMNYFSALNPEEVEFTFVVDQFSKIINKEQIEKKGGKVALVPHYTHVFSYRKALKKLFKEEKFDVVHSNMSTLNFIPLKAAKKAHVKVRIAHGHATSSPDEKLRNLIKNILRPMSAKYANTLVACSKACGTWLFGKKDFSVIPNAINLKRFSFDWERRDKIRRSLKISENFVLGHVGRFVSVKNHMFILEVFAKVFEKDPSARLMLVGSGELEQDIKNKAKELNVLDRIIFTGSVSNPEDYLMAMDCFIFPSYYEGLGLVAVEAQATGLNCFASNRVCKEAKITKNMKFLPLENPEKWAKEIFKAEICDRNNSAEVVKNSVFDIDEQAKNLASFYRGCLK